MIERKKQGIKKIKDKERKRKERKEEYSFDRFKMTE